MITYWGLLYGLTIIEAILVVFLLTMVWRARKIGPVGSRLAGIALIFLLQTIVSLWAYIYWKTEGYGKDVAAPLLLNHLLILSGIILLVDIIRR